jgi:hypothetical protein
MTFAVAPSFDSQCLGRALARLVASRLRRSACPSDPVVRIEPRESRVADMVDCERLDDTPVHSRMQSTMSATPLPP